MIKRHRIWVHGSLALVGVWLFALGGIWFARSQKMTAQKVQQYLDAHALANRNDAERRAILDGLAHRVNRLSFEERQKLRFEQSQRKLFAQMTDDERARYLDQTLPEGMHQVMDAFNKMDPRRRKRYVDHAVNELKRMQTDDNREEIDKALNDQNLKRIIDQGMKSYMSEANASAKLDAQPIIEQIQNILQEDR